MSLLDCICCRKHSNRTATVWDDLETSSPCFLTCSSLMSRAFSLAKHISTHFDQIHRPPASIIALFGELSLNTLAAILGVYLIPVFLRRVGVVRGVAYLPLLGNVEHWTHQLQSNSVEIILVEESSVEKFIASYVRLPTSDLVSVDTSLLDFGLVLIRISWRKEEMKFLRNLNSVSLSSSILTEYLTSHKVSCHVCSRGEESSNLKSNSSSWFSSCKDDVKMGGAVEMERDIKMEVTAKNFAERSSQTGNPRPKQFSSCSCVEEAHASFALPPPEAVAYVLSTSGTTGQPVTVRVPHCSIVPNILDLRSKFNLSPDDVVFNASPLTFDPSVVEIFLALSVGGTLLMVPNSTKLSPSDLAEVLFHRQYVSILQLTPSLLSRWPVGVVKNRLLGIDSCVRVLALGGEQCPSHHQLALWKHPRNTTRVYNLYGITEVSSWASCHEMDFSDLSPSTAATPSLIPLGEPLLGTTLELRDLDSGAIVTRGEGMIWIGGRYRVCLVGDETTPPGDGMRCTGDWGSVEEGGAVVCNGRMDRQMKRSGQRINLDYIQQKISALLQRSCYVHITLRSKSSPSLSQDITSKTRGTQKPHSSNEFSDLSLHNISKLICFLASCDQERNKKTEHEEEQNDVNVLLSKLRGTIPNSWLPDQLVVVSEIPVTSHGKVDTELLLSKTVSSGDTGHQHCSLTSGLQASSGSLTTITREEITAIVLSCTRCLISSEPLSMTTRLVNIGLDSFDIVRLSTDIKDDLDKLAHPLPPLEGLLEAMLDKALGEVVGYLFSILNPQRDSKSPPLTFRKRSSADFVSEDFGPKKVKCHSREEDGDSVKSKDGHVIKVVVEARRRGQYFVNGRLEISEIIPSAVDVKTAKAQHSSSIVWKVNTHKCVDASPLLVLTRQHELEDGAGHLPSFSSRSALKDDDADLACLDAVVYVGSHSHVFMAVELATGKEVWCQELPDRIESSACVSRCGSFVAVGCYDGCLYILKACSGLIHWRFSPLVSKEVRPVKSSPCVDEQTGWIWFGSHDEHLYAVDINEQHIIHRLYPGGGSVFSTPHLDQDSRVIYVATLRGGVCAFHMDKGSTLWSTSISKPIFSSLAMIPGKDSLLLGSVDGFLISLSAKTGQLLYQVPTAGSIFSSCVVVNNERVQPSQFQVFCGSHDKHLYCWNENLGLEWRTFLGSEVYAVPFCHRVCSSGSGMEWYVSVPTTAGLLYTLSIKTGAVVSQLQLPGEIFSSPVALNNRLVVGCRDDYLYCMDICVE